jgi:hypothetical protein
MRIGFLMVDALHFVFGLESFQPDTSSALTTAPSELRDLIHESAAPSERKTAEMLLPLH